MDEVQKEAVRTKTELPVDMAGWIELYRQANAQIKKLEENAELAKSKIQEALGENEIGLIGGKQVVRWVKVSTSRFDSKKALEVLGSEAYEALKTETQSRRFTLVEQDEHN